VESKNLTDNIEGAFNVTGPPGTGKTTWLVRQASRALKRYDANKIMITSMTRAAAAEVAGRESPIPRGNIGTLHSFCYRALSQPTVAETKIGEFNREFPQFRISSSVRDPDNEVEPIKSITRGDALLSELNLMRQQMLDEKLYPERIRVFAAKYNRWKSDNNYLDFTDLIERCIDDVLYAPGIPSVFLGDECQDWSRLESALMEKWGMNTDIFVRVGDPDQSIYQWRGADPNVFRLSNIPVENRRILKQSYRVPRAVYQLAKNWIEQIEERDQVEYLPTEIEGKITISRGTFSNPAPLIDGIIERIDAGQTVMILATCSYMLEPLKSLLRREGIPFHNPYRRTRGDWNPLGGRGVTARDQLFAFMAECADVWGEEARAWTWQDLQRWAKPIESKLIFVRGAKKILSKISQDEIPDGANMTDLFCGLEILNDALRASVSGNYDWYIQHIRPAQRRRFDFLRRILIRRSWSGLRSAPRVIIGTIHSVKGGESDVVYIFPDLSSAGIQQWRRRGPGRDAVIRLFYVAMTRSRNEVVLLQPSSEFNVGSLKCRK